ncbi:GBF-interacting protein 1, N-terminal [Dillenia turbinata]|uniref:GBF-interacting protein 1, N-terminal n=1 Tax=Dillenia turbinata TaxID=194707 RepID=A0AAN8US63_9MAGN
MVSGSRIEGGSQIYSAQVRKTIQSIKEIVENHSEADIYLALKESNMEPNETIQKLLHQDPFHEVKRKRDKKKENADHKVNIEPRKLNERVGQGTKFRSYSDRNVWRGGYSRNALAGVSREFRVVRDNRVIQSTNKETTPASSSAPGSTSTSSNQMQSGGRHTTQASNGPTNLPNTRVHDARQDGNNKKDQLGERSKVANAASRGHPVRPTNEPHSPVLGSTNSVIGVYASSSDPVHVPSPDSRPPAAVGAIKREVGVVGVRRQSSDNSVKNSSMPSTSFSNSLLGRDNPPTTESFRPFATISKSEHVGQTSAAVSASNASIGRSLINNQYGNGRIQQQLMGHQKAVQPNKEWKPKPSQKPNANPGVIGMPAKSVSPPTESSKDLEKEASMLEDKLGQVNINEDQNVIIAEHLRVPETERCRLTFGSFGAELDSSRGIVSGFQVVDNLEQSNREPSPSLSAPESSSDDASASKQMELPDDQVRNSETNSAASGSVSEQQLPSKESTSPQNLNNYSDISLVRDSNMSFTPSETQQHHDPSELPIFPAYDPQTGYDIPYFRPMMDETVRGQGLPSPQESLSSHTANSIPASSIALVQQQQPPVAQMYPQVHVSHFTNLMPYRQFLSPLYVPPMAMPGYSSSPAYPHPSNGNSYLLMPGASSHLGASGLKYGVQQFKPVAGGSPTGFGNFASPTGYAMNTPGVVGGATGLEDSSRLKYKDGNIYNLQAETSEVWIQNARELPGLQSAPYYNMPGQTPQAAYMPSHTGHVSFNPAAAAAQSSHMQFPGGLYHPPPAGAMGNPHHLGPTVGGNVGVGVAAAAPGTQVGAYQQPLGHLNWTTNF